MDLPRVLVVSTGGSDRAMNIAREMGSELLADEDNTRYHVWTIDNKYYYAKVLICAADWRSVNIEPHSVEALVLHHDPKAEEDTKSLDDCLPLVRSLSRSDIFLLACETFDASSSRERVTEWSQNHKFELVEMEDVRLPDIMDNEADRHVSGINRIVEALQTHLWPNRILKSELSNARVLPEGDIDQVEDQLEAIRLTSETQQHSEQLLMESVLDGIMGEENTDFGDIFGRLMDMKEHASTMSSNHRRAAAEQLVTAFWKAMGGDPSEVEDLDQ